MDPLTTLLNDGDPVIAVVGATDDRSKYGARIYRDLKRKGYRVYPVNPNRETVDGDPAYADLGDLPVPPDIVDIVVPPPRTLRILERAAELGLENIWVQPGAEDGAVIERLEQGDFEYMVGGPCIMVRSRARSA